MRDNIRKSWAWHVAALLAAAAVTTAAEAPSHAPCLVNHGIVGQSGDTDRSAPELSTEQMEVALERHINRPVVIDARPYEEYAISHIPGAVCVAARPGLAMSQYTSDVNAIRDLVHGNIDAPIVLYCNGPFCGKSKRLATDLANAGFTHVVRYQLGIPVWRALGHATQSEREAIRATLAQDHTAVLVDTRDHDAFAKGSLPNARSIRFDEIAKAKDDGRLPMLDHNTRIFVVGKDGREARSTAQEIARNAFQNVSFYGGPVDSLVAPEHP
jgi:rhodanese-related sulfurtransferase